MGIILVLIFLFFLLRQKYNFALGVYIVSIFGIPRNIYIEKMIGIGIEIKVWGFFDFRFILVIIMLFYSIFKLKSKYPLKIKISNLLVFFLFSSIFIIALVNGIQNNNELIKSEVLVYIQLFVTMTAITLWIKVFKIDIKDLLYMCIIGGAVYSLVAIYLDFFGKDILTSMYGDFYGRIWGEEGRITFQNVTSLFVISFFSVYMIFRDKNKKMLLITLLVNNIAILLSQTRSIVALYYGCLLIILMCFLIKFIINRHLNLKVLVYILWGGAVLIIAICISGMQLIDGPLFADILKRFTESGSGSIDSRVYTNQYAIESIETPLFGNGIGYALKFFNANGSLVKEVGWIDNLFLSIYVKFGLIGMIALSVLIVYVLVINIKKLIVTRHMYFLIIGIIYVPFMVICTMLTSQLVHSLQVALLFYILLLIPIQYSEKKNNI